MNTRLRVCNDCVRQLGIEESSERYKADVAPMGSSSERIQRQQWQIATQAAQLVAMKSQLADVNALRAEVAELRRNTEQLAVARGLDGAMPVSPAQVAVLK